MRSVLLVQCGAKQYRVPFFDGLHAALARMNVTLRVAYSDSSPSDQQRGDDVVLDPTYGVRVPARWLAGDRLVYQPVSELARGADLVIVEQANKQLINLLILLLRARVGGPKVAFWGQGRNVHSHGRSLAEKVKALSLTQVDWWFAYTQGVAEYLIAKGVRPASFRSFTTRLIPGRFAINSRA